MAQCFVTTYRNHYRWQEPVKTPSVKPVDDQFESVIPSEDIWIQPEDADEDLDPEVMGNLLKNEYLRRYITTYQRAYCAKSLPPEVSKIKPKNAQESDSFSDNQLMESGRNLYEPVTRPKIAPPLSCTRRTFGYIRPTRNYTPLTNYQFWIGKTGYQILKGNYKQPAQILQRLSLKELEGEKEKDERGAEDGGDFPETCECCQRCCCCNRTNKSEKGHNVSKL